MHRSLIAAGLIGGFLFSSDAMAVPRIVYRLQNLQHTASPIHLFGLAFVFLVIFIFGRYLEWSAMLTLGSALLCGLSVGVAGVWAITSDFTKHNTRTAVTAPPETTEASTENASAAEYAVATGKKCANTSECPSGTSCSRVAGQKRCWLPCGEDDSCAAGFGCFATDDGKKVCAK